MSANDLAAISEETVEKIRKAQTSGITSSTGLVGIDLSDVVSLVPCNTPLYDRVPRKSPAMGADVAQWKALLNINTSQPSPFVGLDAGGQLVNFSEQDMMAKFQPVRVSGQVTQDAIARSRNYDDAKARATAGTMIQWRIADNKALWGGQNYALPAIGAVTVATSAGAAIAANTSFQVQARSGLNYYWGGSAVASAAATVGASAVGTATLTWNSVKGAVAYDVFTSAGVYLTTVTVNKAVISSTAAGTVPVLPGLNRTVPTLNTGADGSFSSASYNGLLASLVGDVNSQGLIVTPGTGAVGSGASSITLNGAQLTTSSQGIAEIDNLLASIWGVAELSPDVLWMNAQQAQDIANRVLSTNSAVTFLNPEQGRQGITAGGSVARYLNKAAGGVPVEIVVDPHLPPGRIVAMTERIPYPDSGVVNALEVRTLRDVAQTPYGASLVAGTVGGGPRDVFDVSSIETFLNRAPVACGIITDIAAG